MLLKGHPGRREREVWYVHSHYGPWTCAHHITLLGLKGRSWYCNRSDWKGRHQGIHDKNNGPSILGYVLIRLTCVHQPDFSCSTLYFVMSESCRSNTLPSRKSGPFVQKKKNRSCHPPQPLKGWSRHLLTATQMRVDVIVRQTIEKNQMQEKVFFLWCRQRSSL